MNLQHKPIGNTGLVLPPVVFGSTCLGNLFVQISDQGKRDLVREWFRCMPKPIAIDSAGKYGAGLALQVIGRELSEMGIADSDVLIINKLGWRRAPLTGPEPTFEPGVWIGLEHDAVQDISYDGILRCHQDGCEMLSSYKPQLISAHDPDEYLAAATDRDDRKKRLEDVIGAYKAMAELRDAGEVAGIGVGAKDWKCIQELDKYCDFDWVMMANSLTIMNHPPELIEFVESLQARNVALINSALTHGGFITGGEFFDYRPIDDESLADQERLRYRATLQEVCESHGQSVYDVSVAFGRSHPAVTSIALSTSRVDRVAQMVESATKEMPVELWIELREKGMISEHYSHLP